MNKWKHGLPSITVSKLYYKKSKGVCVFVAKVGDKGAEGIHKKSFDIWPLLFKHVYSFDLIEI